MVRLFCLDLKQTSVMEVSPIHVHVQDNTPVHVHVKKPKSAVIGRIDEQPTREFPGSRRSGKPSKSRSKMINGPWIPAPGKTSLRDRTNNGFKWDGSVSQLEVNTPQLLRGNESSMKMADLNYEEEDAARTHIQNYEKKIEELMKEVGSLQNEVELKKTECDLEDRKLELQVSKEALEQQHEKMKSVVEEYERTEKENMKLRKSVDRIKEDLNGNLSSSRECSSNMLLRKLVDVELSGTACEKQVSALRGVVDRLRRYNISRVPSAELIAMTKDCDSLLEKIVEFEDGNRSLRHLLQSHHEAVTEKRILQEQRDTLLKKVGDSDAESVKLRSEVAMLKNEVEQLIIRLDEEKKHAVMLTELNKSIDATRAHLQKELRVKEMENDRLRVQMKNMERETAVAQKEADELMTTAKIAQDTIGGEKEALKKATRAQKQRADRADQARRELEIKVTDREKELSRVKEESDAWKTRYHRALDDRARSENHTKSLGDKVDELEAAMRRNDRKFQDREQDLTERLHKLTSESTTYQLECERTKGELRTMSEKLKSAHEEESGHRVALKQFETLNSELRADLAKSKNEAEEALLSAERAEREARRMQKQGSEEIERMRDQMLNRMKELQALPELLKEAEIKLKDTQDQLYIHEKRSAEQTKVISELTSRDEVLNDDVGSLKHKLISLSDENRALEARLDIMHAKLDDKDVVLRESAVQKADKDENIQTLQLKFEEKTHLCNSLQRQLDVAIGEARKAAEMERDKIAARERAVQNRVNDMEAQITRAKSDAVGSERSKLDSERKLRSQIQDLQDRLEQSESTNRSMRNYVNFLKSSYSTVFGAEANMTSSPIRGSQMYSSPSGKY